MALKKILVGILLASMTASNLMQAGIDSNVNAMIERLEYQGPDDFDNGGPDDFDRGNDEIPFFNEDNDSNHHHGPDDFDNDDHGPDDFNFDDDRNDSPFFLSFPRKSEFNFNRDIFGPDQINQILKDRTVKIFPIEPTVPFFNEDDDKDQIPYFNEDDEGRNDNEEVPFFNEDDRVNNDDEFN